MCVQEQGLLRLVHQYTEDFILPYGAYSSLLDLLTEDNLKLIFTLNQVSDHMNDASRVLLNIFESQGIAVPYLCQLLANEIKEVGDETIALRGNTLATRSVEAFMKQIGNDYLQYSVKNVLNAIIAERKQHVLDPTKIDQQGAALQDTLKKNLKNLISSVNRLLTAIFESVDRCPVPLREVFGFIQDEVSRHFPKQPSMRYAAVASFIFLRFFCAAILSPHNYNLRDEKPDEFTQKNLLLIAKTLQNLANGVEFGKKEDYMMPLNEYLKKERDAMKLFIDTLSNNWDTAQERVSEIEQELETEKNILVGLTQMDRMFKENLDIGNKKSRQELRQNLLRSQMKIAAMHEQIEKLRRMVRRDPTETTQPTTHTLRKQNDIEYGQLFVVDVEKELASMHRLLSKLKPKILEELQKEDTEESLATASKLIAVLDELEKVKQRIEDTTFADSFNSTLSLVV